MSNDPYEFLSDLLKIPSQRSREMNSQTAPVISPGRVAPAEDDLAIGTGRRLQMAVLFLDVCNFSGRPSETLEEQEQVLRMMNIFFPEMIRVAEKHGGTIEKNTGDGLLAWFEDSFSTEDGNGPVRAFRTALEMTDTNRSVVDPLLRAEGIESVKFRIAIDYGPVTIARVGAPKRFNSYVAIGTKANIASKLLKFGGPDDILLGDVAFQQLGTTYSRMVRPLNEATGWVYRETCAPYPAYRHWDALSLFFGRRGD
jgi:adenylate cyclase